eukprot:CAMPEP_0170468596 /NCGR_PEP_ID=MMETSP0123-20130129/11715_1 /TAXON_ID=182087 /ORGANISM="Favella ehrenbergii, Strain Fehren 1" /LENGTH=74 /DNA_ID=CAMNT_0010735201 /DNA_START=258 /DNA_END=481 /DNA_ORIENTATION=+
MALGGAAAAAGEQASKRIQIEDEEEKRKGEADLGEHGHSLQRLKEQTQSGTQILGSRARVKRHLGHLLVIISMF